jgi:hypothetical protein
MWQDIIDGWFILSPTLPINPAFQRAGFASAAEALTVLTVFHGSNANTLHDRGGSSRDLQFY